MTKFIKLVKSEEKEMMDFMKNNEKRAVPSVGSFFVNPKNKHLFLIDKVDYDKAPQFQKGLENATRRTTERRHPDIWNDNYQEGDYEFTPRGRVFYDDQDKYFIIMTGKWIEDYPHIIEEVKEKFNLKDQDVRQGYHEHWDLGQGNFD